MLMSATTLPLVAAMLLMAAIEIAVACCVLFRVDDVIKYGLVEKEQVDGVNLRLGEARNEQRANYNTDS